MLKAIRHALMIANSTIDRPGPLEINRKIATMGGAILILVEKRASLCSVSVCFFSVFCALEKVVSRPKKTFLAGRLGPDPLLGHNLHRAVIVTNNKILCLALIANCKVGCQGGCHRPWYIGGKVSR